jgi:hypothetical protein
MKKPSIKGLKKKADKAFSDYIRTRDNYICITCGKKGDKHNIDAGHYITRAALPTRYIESNVAAQCYFCNRWRQGEKDIMRQKLIDKFGIDEIERIETERFKTVKYSISDYEMLIEYFENKLVELNSKF